jgi:hypothetical protein
LYFKKQIVFIFLILAFLAGIFSAAASGSETSLIIKSDTGGLHNTLDLPVIVDSPESIAGAAFTIRYPNALQVDVSSDFFSFIRQKPPVIGSEETLLMIAAAGKKDNDPSISEPTKIMTLEVKLEDGDADTYEIKIIPSVISNKEFGYYSTGEQIGLLTKYDPDNPDSLDNPGNIEVTLQTDEEVTLYINEVGTIQTDEVGTIQPVTVDVITKGEANFDARINIPAIMLLLSL